MLILRLERGDPPEHQARVVHQSVEAAEARNGLGDNSVAFARIGDVSLDRERRPASDLDLALDRERGRFVA